MRLVLHDTTEFSFGGEATRTALHRSGKSQRFQSHVSLLVDEGEVATPFGVVGMRNYVVERGKWLEALPNEEFQELLVGSERWRDAVVAVHAKAPQGAPLVHVMDREADDYLLWMSILDQGDHFVVRATHDRAVDQPGGGSLREKLVQAPFVAKREVWLSRRSGGRPPKSRKVHPDRNRRPARLGIRFGQVEVLRPAHIHGAKHTTVALGFVEVIEIGPPAGNEPVCWRLLTTLPVETASDACRIVDIYRRRWIIEEFFRALKTGCAAEKRQAEDLWTLIRTISILVPVAWRLLLLRSVSRQNLDAPAEAIIDEVELEALRTTPAGQKLPRKPTAAQITAAIALLGGHLKANGAPGWIVLFRGLQELISLATGWRAAIRWMAIQHHEKGDQHGDDEM